MAKARSPSPFDVSIVEIATESNTETADVGSFFLPTTNTRA